MAAHKTFHGSTQNISWQHTKHFMAAHKINKQIKIYIATSSQYFISLFLFSKRFDYLTKR